MKSTMSFIVIFGIATIYKLVAIYKIIRNMKNWMLNGLD